MSKEQIAFWGAGGLSTRVNVLEGKTSVNQVNIALLNNAVFPVVYGSFSSTQTQTIPAGNNGLTLTYDTTDIAQNCSLLNRTTVRVSFAGTYRILYSIQANRTDLLPSPSGSFFAYPIVNGVPVPNSTTKILMVANAESCLTVEYILNLTANSDLSIHCWSATTGQQALAIVGTTDYPAVPSIILTLNRIA
jgi:hypothetical protein